MANLTNAEKASLYDQYLRESDDLQAENSRLKSHNAGQISDEDQKKINLNSLKIDEVVAKLHRLFNE